MSTVSCRRRRQQGPLFSVKRKRWPTKLMMFGRPKKKGGKEKIRRLNRGSRKSRPSTFWKISFPGKKRRSSTSFTLIYANKTGRCTNVYSSGRCRRFERFESLGQIQRSKQDAKHMALDGPAAPTFHKSRTEKRRRRRSRSKHCIAEEWRITREYKAARLWGKNKSNLIQRRPVIVRWNTRAAREEEDEFKDCLARRRR